MSSHPSGGKLAAASRTSPASRSTSSASHAFVRAPVPGFVTTTPSGSRPSSSQSRSIRWATPSRRATSWSSTNPSGATGRAASAAIASRAAARSARAKTWNRDPSGRVTHRPRRTLPACCQPLSVTGETPRNAAAPAKSTCPSGTRPAASAAASIAAFARRSSATA